MSAWHLNLVLLAVFAIATYVSVEVYERYTARRNARQGDGRPRN